MSGLVKAKKYDWKDSNMALFGSDTEKQVKKESAEAEPAWEGCGQEEGLKIWRIVKFEVTEWPQEDYGKFYNGDSYIILNTYKPDPDSEQLAFDVHFWIGKYSTQDEYGTAAYKTVEVDTFLDDRAVQHREVQGHESDLFKSYFESMTVMEGGADTGFRHVVPEEYGSRLLKVCKANRNIYVTEIPRVKERLNSDDVFILDQGLTLYQFNGASCSHDEKFKAAQQIQNIKSERGGKPEVEVLEESEIDDSHPFYAALDGEDEEDDDEVDAAGDKQLFKISDASGSLSFDKVAEGEVSKDQLAPEDVFLLDTGDNCFVWVGSGASTTEKKNGLSYALNYLKDNGRPLVKVAVLKEGQQSAAFETAIAA